MNVDIEMDICVRSQITSYRFFRPISTIAGQCCTVIIPHMACRYEGRNGKAENSFPPPKGCTVPPAVSNFNLRKYAI